MDHREITAAELVQIGQVLVPMVQQAMRAEFHALRNDFNASLLKQTADLTQQISAVEKRVSHLESINKKAIAGWGAIVIAATLLLEWVKGLIHRL